ncbi:hydroxyethylthiazole kinase [Rathayibacter sp. CAU 1779]
MRVDTSASVSTSAPSTTAEETDWVAASAEALEHVRARAPLVQCVTNAVVTGFTANVLLSLGASPAMVDIQVEAGVFARVADGVLVNLGTPHAEQRAAAREAVASAIDAGTPWVLDPVAIGVLPVRTELARHLVERRPSIIRGNASEIVALAGAGSGGRGVDAVDTPEDAADAATSIALASRSVVAISGELDLITDGDRVVRVGNGTPLLTRVTGGGCALGAVMAAFAGVCSDPMVAAVAATTIYTVAAEQAATGCAGPGSFAVGLLDRLAAVSADDILASAVLS